MTRRKLRPIHPGEILTADFLEPLRISQYGLARDISVPPRRINEIVHGKSAISADTALRLARYFGTSERFWLNLQSRFDLEVQRDALGKRLDREVRPANRLGRVAERLNRVYASEPEPLDPAVREAARRTLKRSKW